MADILLGNIKGPQGEQGRQGEQGERGDAATITVGTVSTTAYGNTAQVTNSGTEQDAILDFVIPQGKPGEQTTRMGALTLDTITAQSADFPIPAVGETGSTVFGKIIKFFNSTVSALNSKLNISDVVNNLTSTSTTQPLSAAQGKALNDAIGTANTAIAAVDSKIASTITLLKTSDSSPITLSRANCALIGNKIVVVDAAFQVTGTISSNVLQYMFYFLNREFSASTDLQCTKLMSGGTTSGNVIIPFLADATVNRIGVNGGSTSQLTSGTAWWLTGIVFLK